MSSKVLSIYNLFSKLYSISTDLLYILSKLKFTFDLKYSFVKVSISFLNIISIFGIISYNLFFVFIRLSFTISISVLFPFSIDKDLLSRLLTNLSNKD